MSSSFLARSRWLAANILPHEASVRSSLRRMTQLSEVDIDDVIQETYAILAKLEDVGTIRDPRSYMIQVAKSVFLQNLRRSKIVTIESIADMTELQTVDESPSPEQHAHGQRELRRVEAAIRSMPPQVGKVFWLRRVEGLSQRETAESLGIAEHTVEKYLAKGVKLLLAQFREGGNEDAQASRGRHLALVGTDILNDRSTSTR